MYRRKQGKDSVDEIIERICWEGIEGDRCSKTSAARILGCSRQTVYNMCYDGRLDEDHKGLITVRSIWAVAKGSGMA